jgi:hypothetical protein
MPPFLTPVDVFPVTSVNDNDGQDLVDDAVNTPVIAKAKPEIRTAFKPCDEWQAGVGVLGDDINLFQKPLEIILGD